MPRIDPEFDRNVFLNWPYDQAYAPISEAIVFAIEDSGFHARSARGRLDSSEVRLHKIVDLISDIGGQDVQHHGNDPKTAVARVRDWLRSESGVTSIPGGARIYDRYLEFRRDLPGLCVQLRLDAGDLSFVDLAAVIGMWSEDHR